MPRPDRTGPLSGLSVFDLSNSPAVARRLARPSPTSAPSGAGGAARGMRCVDRLRSPCHRPRKQEHRGSTARRRPRHGVARSPLGARRAIRDVFRPVSTNPRPRLLRLSSEQPATRLRIIRRFGVRTARTHTSRGYESFVWLAFVALTQSVRWLPVRSGNPVGAVRSYCASQSCSLEFSLRSTHSIAAGRASTSTHAPQGPRRLSRELVPLARRHEQVSRTRSRHRLRLTPVRVPMSTDVLMLRSALTKTVYGFSSHRGTAPLRGDFEDDWTLLGWSTNDEVEERRVGIDPTRRSQFWEPY